MFFVGKQEIEKALNFSIGDLDLEYTHMQHDLEVVSKLVIQLEQFINELPNMDISIQNKQKHLSKANNVLEQSKKTN